MVDLNSETNLGMAKLTREVVTVAQAGHIACDGRLLEPTCKASLMRSRSTYHVHLYTLVLWKWALRRQYIDTASRTRSSHAMRCPRSVGRDESATARCTRVYCQVYSCGRYRGAPREHCVMRLAASELRVVNEACCVSRHHGGGQLTAA